MFNINLADRLFAPRSVGEILADAASGYISVLPYTRNAADKTTLLHALRHLGESVETMTELLANGDVSRLQKYYASIESK